MDVGRVEGGREGKRKRKGRGEEEEKESYEAVVVQEKMFLGASENKNCSW